MTEAKQLAQNRKKWIDTAISMDPPTQVGPLEQEFYLEIGPTVDEIVINKSPANNVTVLLEKYVARLTKKGSYKAWFPR